MLLENNLFFITFLLYLASAILYLAYFWLQADKALRLGISLFTVALASHTIALIIRSLAGGRLPFASIYEFILVFSWGVAVLYLLACGKYKIHTTGAVVLPLEVLLVGYALTVKTAAAPLVPALQSMWLKLHVGSAVLAYSFFALSFAASALYLWQGRKDSLPFPLQNIEKVIYYFIAAGFPFMTMVLITGSVWAEEVWASWWNWDPKETWALITWLIYAIYLHLSRTRQWSGRVAAWVALWGFAAVIFTLFGVTFLMPGAHSY